MVDPFKNNVEFQSAGEASRRDPVETSTNFKNKNDKNKSGFEIWVFDLFRVSIFEFRIWKKLFSLS